jgi:hypothetical protein
MDEQHADENDEDESESVRDNDDDGRNIQRKYQ